MKRNTISNSRLNNWKEGKVDKRSSVRVLELDSKVDDEGKDIKQVRRYIAYIQSERGG